MADRGRLLITGGAGHIGRVSAEPLAELGWTIRLLDSADLPDGPHETVQADITDRAALAEAMRDVDAVLHLAGIASEASWPDILSANIDGTHAVLDAARRAGVGRAVLASSCHAMGFEPYPADGSVVPDFLPARPDTYYGVSKAALEALGSLYHDRYGMDIVCVRIGAYAEEPYNRTAVLIWLSAGDAVRLFDAALTAPGPLYRVVWGVSDNTRRTWSLAAARSLGYDPQDDSEIYAHRFDSEPMTASDVRGARMTGSDMTGPDLDDD